MTHAPALHGGDHLLLIPEQAHRLVVEGIAAVDGSFSGLFFPLAGAEVGTGAEVFAFRGKHNHPAVVVAVQLVGDVRQGSDQVMIEEVVWSSLNLEQRDKTTQIRHFYITDFPTHDRLLKNLLPKNRLSKKSAMTRIRALPYQAL